MIQPKKLGAKLSLIFTSILLSACELPAHANTPTVKQSLKEAESIKDIRTQTLTFTWRGQTVSHNIFCAPTNFPPFRAGGGDPFSGAVPSGQIRKAASGMSPIPQWSIVDVKDAKLLLNLHCSDQWRGKHKLTPEKAAQNIRGYVYSDQNGRVGLTPTTLSNISLTTARKLTPKDDLSSQLAAQMQSLKPMSKLLRPFPKATFSDPTLIKIGRILPPKDDRPFRSEPWLIQCDGELPQNGSSADLTTSKEPAFYKLGQDVLSQSAAFSGCKFIRPVDVNSINYQDRPRSPYPPLKALHLVTENGDEAFVEAKWMTLNNSEMFLHADTLGSYKGKLDRDPFLDSVFFNTIIKPHLSLFEGANYD